MYYGARYYDAQLGRFISADTIVPGAGNPQSLNRYTYALNNPLRYKDPSGHCVSCFLDYLSAFGKEYWRNVGGWVSPATDDALAVKSNETAYSTFGRLVADVVTFAQGIGEVDSGATIAGVGLAACGSGVGCAVSPEAALAGGAVIVHGVATGGRSVTNGLKNAEDLLSYSKGHHNLEDPQGVIEGWSVDENFGHSSLRDLKQ